MSLLAKLKGKLKRMLRRTPSSFNTEEEFYTYFFTQNPGWSSPEPNEDESIRWAAISKALDALALAKNSTEILEIGCGRGWLTHKLSRYGTATGIEPVAPVVAYARKLFPGIAFHAGYASAFLENNPGKAYDLVVSTEVIEHATDKSGFIAEIHQLLRPGGHVILTTPRAEHYDDFTAHYGKEAGQPVEEWLSEPELAGLWEANGFETLNKTFLAPLADNKPQILMTQLWVCRKKS